MQEPPQWEYVNLYPLFLECEYIFAHTSACRPDIKPHIPSELTQPSIANAYARLSAPPPNLPPRRTQPLRLSASPPPRSTRSMGLARTAEARAEADAGPSTIIPPSSMVQPVASSSTAPPPGALDLPPTDEPMLESSSAPTSPTRPRPTAEKEIFLRATDKTPIWSTHYLDPCLHTSLMNVPHQVTNAANVALTGLSSGQKSRYNSTVGAPIDGMARAARDWIVPADAKFVSEIGGIEVGVAVVDGGLDGWGKEKGRRRARVEAISKQGGIKIDVVCRARSELRS